MAKQPTPPPHPFADSELREMEVVVGKIQEACDERRERLLILEPAEARLLRKLLHHLRTRK